MALLLDLRVDGPPVTGTDDRDRVMECERLLGVMLTETAMKGGSLKLTFLC